MTEEQKLFMRQVIIAHPKLSEAIQDAMTKHDDLRDAVLGCLRQQQQVEDETPFVCSGIIVSVPVGKKSDIVKARVLPFDPKGKGGAA